MCSAILWHYFWSSLPFLKNSVFKKAKNREHMRKSKSFCIYIMCLLLFQPRQTDRTMKICEVSDWASHLREAFACAESFLPSDLELSASSGRWSDYSGSSANSATRGEKAAKMPSALNIFESFCWMMDVMSSMFFPGMSRKSILSIPRAHIIGNLPQGKCKSSQLCQKIYKQATSCHIISSLIALGRITRIDCTVMLVVFHICSWKGIEGSIMCVANGGGSKLVVHKQDELQEP